MTSITVEEVKSSLKEMKGNKSSGEDQMPQQMLKELKQEAAKARLNINYQKTKFMTTLVFKIGTNNLNR